MKVLSDLPKRDASLLSEARRRELMAARSVERNEALSTEVNDLVQVYFTDNTPGRTLFLQTMARGQSFARAGLEGNGTTVSCRTGSDRVRFINRYLNKADKDWRKRNLVELYELPNTGRNSVYVSAKDLIFRQFRPFLLDCDEKGHILPRRGRSSFESNICALYDEENDAYVVDSINELLAAPFLNNGQVVDAPYEYGYIEVQGDGTHRIGKVRR